jgi:hypothetical protein
MRHDPALGLLGRVRDDSIRLGVCGTKLGPMPSLNL